MGLTWLVPAISIAGTALLAAPIIIHLLFRQKPKRLPFPALRLLQQRKRTLVRKLRLRHLLLLLLRLLVLGGVIAALGRPLIIGGSRFLASSGPIAAVLIFDTSASMGYSLEGQTRLQRAQALATEYLRQLPEGSKVAVVDSADPRLQFRDPKEAQVIIDSLQIRFDNRPVMLVVRDVLQRLNQPDAKRPDLPLVCAIFSDRTPASWSGQAASQIRELLKNLATPTDSQESQPSELPVLYFDLSPARPTNVAITGISLVVGEAVLPLEKLLYGLGRGQQVTLQAEVRAAGPPLDTELELLVGEQIHDSKRFQIHPEEGRSKTVTVRFRPFTIEGATRVQGRVRLKSPDLLDSDNVRYWTLFAQQHPVWLVADKVPDLRIWQNALEALSQRGLLPVKVEVLTTDQLAARLGQQPPQVLCILHVAKPTNEFWQRLSAYVRMGGRLVIGLGSDLLPDAYNTDAAAEVLPVRVKGPMDLPFDTFVEVPNLGAHPLFSAYREWNTDLSVGRVYRIWDTELLYKAEQPLGLVLARVSHEAKPFVLERYFDSQQGSGRVLVFTTPLFRRTTLDWSDWNNFHVPWQTNFALPFLTVRYLLQAQAERSNWLLGEETPAVLLPSIAEAGFSWELRGPENRSGTLEHRQRELFFERLGRPGNYTVRDLQDRWGSDFSVNLPPNETEFLEGRISDEEIRAAFGDKSLLQADNTVELVELARSRSGQAPPLELLPWLLMLVVLLLAIECWVANRFYKPDTSEESENV